MTKKTATPYFHQIDTALKVLQEYTTPSIYPLYNTIFVLPVELIASNQNRNIILDNLHLLSPSLISNIDYNSSILPLLPETNRNLEVNGLTIGDNYLYEYENVKPKLDAYKEALKSTDENIFNKKTLEVLNALLLPVYKKSEQAHNSIFKRIVPFELPDSIKSTSYDVLNVMQNTAEEYPDNHEHGTSKSKVLDFYIQNKKNLINPVFGNIPVISYITYEEVISLANYLNSVLQTTNNTPAYKLSILTMDNILLSNVVKNSKAKLDNAAMIETFTIDSHKVTSLQEYVTTNTGNLAEEISSVLASSFTGKTKNTVFDVDGYFKDDILKLISYKLFNAI